MPKAAPIEEGRAASKSPNQKFGYFLSISQQAVSPISFKFSCGQLLHKTEGTILWRQAGTQANRRQKLGLVWRNRKNISQIINDHLCLTFFLLIILWPLHLPDEEPHGRQCPPPWEQNRGRSCRGRCWWFLPPPGGPPASSRAPAPPPPAGSLPGRPQPIVSYPGTALSK